MKIVNERCIGDTEGIQDVWKTTTKIEGVRKRGSYKHRRSNGKATEKDGNG